MNIPLRLLTVGIAGFHLAWCSTSSANNKVCWTDANGKTQSAIVAGKCGDYVPLHTGGLTCENLPSAVKAHIERGPNGRTFLVLDGARMPIASDAVVNFLRDPRNNRTPQEVQKIMRRDDGRVSERTIRRIAAEMNGATAPKRQPNKAEPRMERNSSSSFLQLQPHRKSVNP
ncbi:MAG: hypothetical protein QOH88_463 [Verrucomicrobiota bacterium]|jgi:hypothetical protein